MARGRGRGASTAGLALALAVAIALAAGGCLSLTPAQEERVTDVQRFADATTKAYGLPRVRVNVERETNLGIGARYRQGNFYLNVRMLGSPSLDAIVAHEMAHYVLGHDTLASGVVTQADWQRVQEEREMDANATSVEVLVRGRGLTQREALETMVTFLRAAQRAIDRGGAVATGHRQPREEIDDLLARYPASAVGSR